MAPTLESLKSHVLELPEDSRAALAAFLLETLDPPAAERTEEAWLKEALRRHEELKSGAVEGRPWEDVLAKAQEKLR